MVKRKRRAAVPTKAEDAPTKPLDMRGYPRRVWAISPTGKRVLLRIAPGHDGPFIVDDGVIVPSPVYPGWVLDGA